MASFVPPLVTPVTRVVIIDHEGWRIDCPQISKQQSQPKVSLVARDFQGLPALVRQSESEL